MDKGKWEEGIAGPSGELSDDFIVFMCYPPTPVLGQVVRRVKLTVPSLFPSPQRPQNPPVRGDTLDFDLSFLSFETLASFKALPKPLRNRF